MLILWDEPKRRANLDKHGLDFAAFEASFNMEAALERPTRASGTGRSRSTLIGWWSGCLVVVVVASRLGREAMSLVSIRPANQKERDLYDGH
ncbi:BrnT family toxin [Lichenihabitans sp. Uapishka_5]|uniref:BrnT family toxin n=1 Tax=Lichenihabitans sp. Uapishka_5 TaxID=3037302 RepID=UPI0029E7DA2B|nr:BrnT family toxin [Lichenihabitans sp. Uapishka_5]MDX7953580.1 BrnT family toxin [Lichenihabitans sp. Uapishka_5]